MEIDRRRLLQAFGLGLVRVGGGLGAGAGVVVGVPAAQAGNASGPLEILVGCATDQRRRSLLLAVDTSGKRIWELALPARGHDTAIVPGGQELAVFGRRPGDYLWVVDATNGRLLQPLSPPNDRVGYGHGVFSRDGRWLYTTENDFEHGRGCIGIYDRDEGYRRVGELPSHGTGPHELVLHPADDMLIVANGGIRTHPDSGRAKLNLDSMAPNLAWIDPRDGRLLDRWQPPARWHRISIRHLDINRRAQVAVAMQYQGPATEQPPLVALHDPGAGTTRLLSAPAAIQQGLRNYCGSVRWSADGERFAVTAPRGGLVTEWSTGGSFISHHRQADACGLTAQRGGFLVSDGSGGLAAYPSPGAPVNVAGLRWDNHLRLFAAAPPSADPAAIPRPNPECPAPASDGQCQSPARAHSRV